MAVRKRFGAPRGKSVPPGIVPESIVRHELIGLECMVLKCTDPAKEGVSGKIIDETQKMLAIETGKGDFLVAKKECMFSIRLPGGELAEIDGRLLYGRPEDRIKKKFPKSWRELA